MPFSDVDICNMALACLGVGQTISDLDTDETQEANAANQFLEVVREQVIRDFPWPFASTLVTLGLESDPDEAYNTEYFYAYRYPADCVAAKRMPTGLLPEPLGTRVPFRISSDSEGKLILTNLETATLEYTRLVTDATLYPSDFVMAMSYRMAWHMAPMLARGDPMGLGMKALQMYQMEISKAKANAAQEEMPERQADAEWIQGR